MIFFETIIRIFVEQKEAIEIGKMIYIISPSSIAVAITMGLDTVFTGSGYNMPYLISAGLQHVGFFRFPIPYWHFIYFTCPLPSYRIFLKVVSLLTTWSASFL